MKNFIKSKGGLPAPLCGDPTARVARLQRAQSPVVAAEFYTNSVRLPAGRQEFPPTRAAKLKNS